MTKPIYTCLWYDGQAQEACDYYSSIFRNSKTISADSLVVYFELDGVKLMGLNGGPMYSINPSISLFVTCDTDEEVNYYWEKLRAGGSELIPLSKYEWSDNYGWCRDKFGLTWQIYKGKKSEVNQRIVPLLLFANKHYGQTEEAVNFYTSLFRNSEITGILLYGKDKSELEGKVMHSQFILDGKVFMAMDGPGDHDFDFSEGVSFVVECETQAEIDFYWDAFTREGEESMCGWCKDKFGVSWQIIPASLKDLMSDPEKRQKVIDAFLKMRKFDLATLNNIK